MTEASCSWSPDRACVMNQALVGGETVDDPQRLCMKVINPTLYGCVGELMDNVAIKGMNQGGENASS